MESIMGRISTSALRKIRHDRPATVSAFKKIFRLRSVGRGVFREVYRIVGTGLVVKLVRCYPEYNRPEGIRHARSEVNRIKRLRALGVLRVHLPTIHYWDRKTGTIVMDEYVTESSENITLLGKVIQKMVKKLIGVSMTDIHRGNIGVARVKVGKKYHDRIIFLDLGY
jgi:hypothetical protein